MFYIALTVKVVEQLYHEIKTDALADMFMMTSKEMLEGM